MSATKDIAKTIVTELAGSSGEPLTAQDAVAEVEKILTKHEDTIKDLPKPFLAGLARSFTGGSFDPKAYAETIHSMSDEELLTEIRGTTAEIDKLRQRIDARDALLKDLRDTGIAIARRAIVAALIAAI